MCVQVFLPPLQMGVVVFLFSLQTLQTLLRTGVGVLVTEEHLLCKTQHTLTQAMVAIPYRCSRYRLLLAIPIRKVLPLMFLRQSTLHLVVMIRLIAMHHLP